MEDIKEKTADEMFEELGYEIEIDNEIVRYKQEYGAYFGVIEFEEKFIHSYCDDCKISMGISMKELQAINKKCKELNWLGDE